MGSGPKVQKISLMEVIVSRLANRLRYKIQDLTFDSILPPRLSRNVRRLPGERSLRM